MNSAQNRTPQRLSGNKDVQFFSVGQLAGRTLVVYMKKKGMESVFRVLEPIIGKINEPTRAGGAFSRFGFGVQRSEWFRIYRVSSSDPFRSRVTLTHLLGHRTSSCHPKRSI